MHGRSSDQTPQQWSVHAQFTISHPGIDDPNSTPDAHTEQNENGIRMFYTWPPKPNSAVSNVNEESAPTAATDAGKFSNSPSYGFQRGNLTFTSTPPKKPLISSEPNPNKPGNTTGCAQDSGYTSIPSTDSFAGINLNRIPQNCNRKCKSTCSIILSTTINEQPELEEASQSIPQQTCGRTQSLRCQTIVPKLERPSNFYGCGDPWCYHSTYGDEASTSYSPVQESEESYSTGQTVIKRPLRGNTFATSDYYKKSNLELKGIWEPENRQKDAAVQTLEMVDKCTSPFLTAEKFRSRDQQRDKKKKSPYNSRSKTEPIFAKKRSPICFTPDSLDSQQSERSSSHIYEKQSAYSDKKSETSTNNESSKKPRTVHIDVYCTGTEQESEGSSSETESKTSAQTETVFNSDKVRIMHSRSDDKNMPMNFRKQLQMLDAKKGIKETESKLKLGNESDYGDNSSTAYPSQISSYSAMPNLSSFASTMPSSWSTYPINTSLDNDYDSLVNTSWKDTFSSIDSLNPSRSSIAQTDSLDFIPKRFATYEKSDNLDEVTRKNVESSSVVSLNPSDSFEYENSEDRFRIKEMEQMWNKPKNLKFPQLDQKHLLQQQKLKAYVEKRLKNANLTKLDSKDSDSGSDSSEKGWSFVKEDDKKVQRNITVRGPTRDGETEDTVKIVQERNSFPQSNTRFVKSPSVAALQQKLLLNPRLRAPFMIVPGVYTNQRTVAKKFGSVVDVFRKPGHHIGPAKNPVCQCDHCKSYFENLSRNRTLSVGEIPMNNPWMNWRNTANNS